MTEPNTDKSIKKVCTKCKEEFEATTENFYRQKGGKFGLYGYCKKCKYSSRILNQHKKNEDESIKQTCSICKEKKPATKDYFYVNKSKRYGINAQCRICLSIYRSDPSHIKKRKEREKTEKSKGLRRSRYIKRINNDYMFKLTGALRSRLRKAIKFNRKSDNTLSLMGLDSIEYLKEYLESQFDDHMSWDNHGLEGWHIDHIIPCSAYNFSIEEDQIRCFNYRNLRPMWGKDNLSKGGTLDMELIKEFGIEDLLPVRLTFHD